MPPDSLLLLCCCAVCACADLLFCYEGLVIPVQRRNAAAGNPLLKRWTAHRNAFVADILVVNGPPPLAVCSAGLGNVLGVCRHYCHFRGELWFLCGVQYAPAFLSS